MKILMGTKNPGKIEGAKQAFEQYFDNIEIEGIAVESEVSNQPFDDEIIKGARNRIKNVKEYARKNNIDADFYIASEAGITTYLGEYVDFNIAMCEDKNGLESMGISPGFTVPEKYIDEIKASEFGKVFDRLFNEKDLHNRGGGINKLTKEVITRIDLTRCAFIMALTKYINGELWK